MAPPVGLEPTTPWLTVRCSTDWAKEECKRTYGSSHISFITPAWAGIGLCRQWPIFPGRLRPSIFGTAELNFRVRNGNGWTLRVIITDSHALLRHAFCGAIVPRWASHCRLKCQHWPIFPGRLQPSIFGTAELNFRVRNGNGWTLRVINTDF